MKYERTTLKLATPPAGSELHWSVQALRVGDWYAHRPLGSDDPGTTISHCSGLRAVGRLSPSQTVRVLRALQSVPPCPVDDAAFVALAQAEVKPLAIVAQTRPWMALVREAIASAAGPLRLGVSRRA